MKVQRLADHGNAPVARHPSPRPQPSQRASLLREVHAAEEGLEAGAVRGQEVNHGSMPG